ncbi:hypothetical protein Fmac_007475 [Flemingia macrophylla]|uniref:Uncharacterized protein n=1 Tax=Flemingia macrophylla TaxID=520843 RepID=A0ABD1MUN9_9FABA
MCCEREETNMKSSTAKTGKRKRSPHRSPRPKDSSPIRAIACLNKIDDMRRFEETEDCFILGFDPSAPVPLSTSCADDLAVIAEKGQVACRDYPHSRHLCLKFPFKTTPHESHCEMCYCYVCDSTAPCNYWKGMHCNAENVGYWALQRNIKKLPQLRLYNSQP